jgi:hypothetical protein
MRRIPILVGVFGAVLLGAVGAGPAIGSGGRAIPDVQKLFRSAVAQVRAADHGVFAKAVLFEADGSTRGGGLVCTARPGCSAGGSCSTRVLERDPAQPARPEGDRCLAYYFFGTPRGYVTVDVVTGKVAAAS